jgi:hypothetical protein
VDDSIVAAARVIVPFLGQLVEPATAADLQARIGELLDQAGKGEDTSAELRATLESDEAAKEFTRQVIRDAPYFRPPGQQQRHLRYPGDLPGPPQYISVPKYVCPRGGDTTWYRPSISFPVPECEKHHVRLVEVAPDAGT